MTPDAPVRVVFLDFDGVLNNLPFLHALQDPRPERGIDPVAVALLNDLVRLSNAMVVVSSDWRHGRSPVELQRILSCNGFVGTVLGVTPACENGVRREEIQLWLNTTTHRVKSFVIFDDEHDLGHLRDHLVQTTFEVGLTRKHINLALEILSVPKTVDTAAMRRLCDDLAEWKPDCKTHGDGLLNRACHHLRDAVDELDDQRKMIDHWVRQLRQTLGERDTERETHEQTKAELQELRSELRQLSDSYIESQNAQVKTRPRLEVSEGSAGPSDENQHACPHDFPDHHYIDCERGCGVKAKCEAEAIREQLTEAESALANYQSRGNVESWNPADQYFNLYGRPIGSGETK